VTSARIAREAGVDPALVRYHFGNRETLLLAVVEEIIAAHRAAHPPLDAPPAEQLAGRVRDTVRLARGAQSMQGLLIGSHPVKAAEALLRVLGRVGLAAAQGADGLEVFDAVRGERRALLLAGPVDPDETILGLHLVDQVEEDVFIFLKIGGDPSQRVDVADLVELHVQAA
jgi:AcrR family transcriptional regulator